LQQGTAEIARASNAGSISAVVAGEITDRDPIDRLLQTSGRNDAELAALLYERFGTDGFLRISGRFAIALFDREARTLVLARDPSGAIPLFLHRKAKEARFSTDARSLAREVGASIDRSRLARWAELGLDPGTEECAFDSIEAVPPGSSIAIDEHGRAKRRLFWTFTPLDHPREISIAEAERELERVVARAIARAGVGPRPEVDAEPLARRLIATDARAGEECSPAEDSSLLAAARLLDRPVPFTQIARIASRMGRDGDLVVDLGFREVFGATAGALAAYIEGFAIRLAAAPGRRTLLEMFARALPVDRALEGRAFHRSLEASAAIVARRWARRISPRTESLAERWIAAPTPREPPIPSYTGDAYVDRRFAEARDSSLLAAQAALVRGRAGRVAIPFLDPEVVELAFQLPPECFLEGDRMLRVVRGGISTAIEPTTILPPIAMHTAAEALKAVDHAPPLDPEALDRWAGLGLYLRSRRS
jgi:glutamine amidotransferase-like protein